MLVHNVSRLSMSAPMLNRSKISFGKADDGGPLVKMPLDRLAGIILPDSLKRGEISEGYASKITGAMAIVELNRGLPSVEIQRRLPAASATLENFVKGIVPVL